MDHTRFVGRNDSLVKLRGQVVVGCNGGSLCSLVKLRGQMVVGCSDGSLCSLVKIRDQMVVVCNEWYGPAQPEPVHH